MNIEDYQFEVEKWVEHNFGKGTPMSAVVGLAEEVGELCRAILKQYQQVRGSYTEWQEEIKKELGDVFIKICDVANEADIDLSTGIKSRWTEVKKRDFKANPIGHGISQDYADSAE